MKKILLIMLAVLILLAVGYVAWFPESKPMIIASIQSFSSSLQKTPNAPSRIFHQNQSTHSKVANLTALKTTTNQATNTASFVSAPPGEVLFKSDPNKSPEANASDFFRLSGGIFGIHDPAKELKIQKTDTDNLGMSHLTYQQQYQGVEVFGGTLKVHFNQEGDITAANGTFVPNIKLNTTPNISYTQAQAVAVQSTPGNGVAPITTALLVFRENLAKKTPGSNYLAYKVEVGNGANIRKYVFVDAQRGTVIHTINAINNLLYRRAYDGRYKDDYANYPNKPFWVEGNPLPFTGFCNTRPNFPDCKLEADNILQTMKATYDLFFNTFGRDSFDGKGSKMDIIFNYYANDCPNAAWNGEFVYFCPGVTGRDSVAHEWAHAYTQFTANLVYEFQSGALNEAYSDIWGETLDLMSGPGKYPRTIKRTDGDCSKYADSEQKLTMQRIGELKVTYPSNIAGVKQSFAASFGPIINAVFSGEIVAVSPSNGCGSISGSLNDKIAIIDRGDCSDVEKIKNAEAKDAAGVVIVDNEPNNLGAIEGSDNTVTIPSVVITLEDGKLIKETLKNSRVEGRIRPGGPVVNETYRWLSGENDTASGTVRDLWNPNCKNNPTKVSDHDYWCFPGDSGGVHINSGIPNRTFALLVDGSNGTDNIEAIGLLKAAHLHYRVLSTYLVSTSGFADYADALLKSCNDLQGVQLKGFDGKMSKESISKNDCAQVQKVTTLLELHQTPRCRISSS